MPYRIPSRERPVDTLSGGQKVITTAGSEGQLASSTSCLGVLITAKPANTGNVYLGWDNTVSSTAGTYGKLLAAGEDVWLPVDDPSKVWLDVSVNGEGVDFFIIKDTQTD